jgi:predicted O-linked N-acetylglucosamine transferase (SPINDLY family)
VEVFCYAEVAAPDAATAKLQSLTNHWRPTAGLADEELAALIRGDHIDVLVELAGHTAGNRLLALAGRPAPVQVNWLGYPGTTGLPAIDYRLVDAVTDPPGEPSAASEELVRLPGLFCCYAPPAPTPAVSALPSQRTGVVTFGSLHKLEKLNCRVVDLWCQILREVPRTRLLVCRDPLHGPTAAYWRQQFLGRGVAPEQVELRRVQAIGMSHLVVYDEIDIALDPFPWNGHTTACEALWRGVPVVALRGTRHAARMVASVLTGLGLADLVAETTEQYVQLAVTLASDETRRAGLRQTLCERMRASPLCDGATFTRGLEATYRQLWQRWCQGQQTQERIPRWSQGRLADFSRNGNPEPPQEQL